MTIEHWIMLYVALGIGWAILSAIEIIPAIRGSLYGLPFTVRMSPVRAAKMAEFTKKFKKRIDDSMLPDSWIVPILSIAVMVICLERGLLWPVSVVKYVIKRWNE